MYVIFGNFFVHNNSHSVKELIAMTCHEHCIRNTRKPCRSLAGRMGCRSLANLRPDLHPSAWVRVLVGTGTGQLSGTCGRPVTNTRATAASCSHSSVELSEGGETCVWSQVCNPGVRDRITIIGLRLLRSSEQLWVLS